MVSAPLVASNGLRQRVYAQGQAPLPLWDADGGYLQTVVLACTARRRWYCKCGLRHPRLMKAGGAAPTVLGAAPTVHLRLEATCGATDSCRCAMPAMVYITVLYLPRLRHGPVVVGPCGYDFW